MSLVDRLKNAYSAFTRRNEDGVIIRRDLGQVSTFRPDRLKLNYGNERSIVAAVYNRIAVDCAQIKMEVVKVNENGQYEETYKDSGLNNVLTLEANIDQSGRALIQDIVMSLIDEGCVAVVPTWTDIDPKYTEGYDILAMRVGKITQWFPQYVRVRLYNDRTGIYQEITLPKNRVAIIENPFYAIMNEPNSTLKRLTRKLNMLDVVDEQTSSGKLDIIIQLPYVIKSEARKAQAEQRRSEIEQQLMGSKYGIAYTDGTEHITQLNRPAENNLLSQIEYLTNLLFSQLGITQAILEGTADEQTMNNYYERTIEPIITAITDEFTRKFTTKTARTQGKTVHHFNDPFRFVPTSKLPDLADKLTRNEILSSNEFRAVIGYKPSDDPKADQLINSNINQSKNQNGSEPPEELEEDGLPPVHGKED